MNWELTKSGAYVARASFNTTYRIQGDLDHEFKPRWVIKRQCGSQNWETLCWRRNLVAAKEAAESIHAKGSTLAFAS